MNARIQAPDLPPTMIDSPALRSLATSNDRAWTMPTDLVMKLPTSSAMVAVIRGRQAKGDWPLPMSRVFIHVDRYFADVPFGRSGQSLIYALDVWPFDVKPAVKP